MEINHEMMGYMHAAEDKNAPDGAWWAILEDAARAYAEMKGITVDANEAVHQYIDWEKPKLPLKQIQNLSKILLSNLSSFFTPEYKDRGLGDGGGGSLAIS